jgi:TRAP transporter 4TM/12TM fusion protein
MSDPNATPEPASIRNASVAALVGLPAVLLVLANSFPKLGTLPSLSIADEILRPIAFACLIIATVIARPLRSTMRGKFAGSAWLGTAIDIVAILVILGFAAVYVQEMAVEKPAIFARYFTVDADPMQRLISGPPLWVIATALLATAVLLVLTARNWGLALVVVALLASCYTVICALSTRFGWAPGNGFLNYSLGNQDPFGEIRKFLITGDAHSLLGQFSSILLSVVLPFVLLGSLFAATGGGNSMIKLALGVTRNMSGGAAHGAIVSSSLFGSISGGPVVNVLATGPLTIPMMVRRGFSKSFAGGVEAAASSGGQIMPPIMGVAAFFLANFTAVPYSQVIVAAVIPALLYYYCLFMSAQIEASRLGIEPIGELPDALRMQGQDWLNLLIIFVPLLLIILVLASEAYTVAAAGIFGIIVLLPLTLLDPKIRRAPIRLWHATAEGIISIGKLFLLFVTVALVDSALSATGFSNTFGAMVSRWAESGVSMFGLTLPPTFYLFLVLLMTMAATVVLGMGMPTLPAYANVAITMTGGLVLLGLSGFAANMFVFYFAAASAITPPVAVAAFAAASVSGGNPLTTGLHALRLGLSMFIVPFLFVFYPELLLIDAAFTADAISGKLIDSRPYGFEGATFVSIMVRALIGIYVLASALGGFDGVRLPRWERVLRLAVGILMLCTPAAVYLPASIIAVVLLLWRHVGRRRTAPALP